MRRVHAVCMLVLLVRQTATAIGGLEPGLSQRDPPK